MKTTPHQLPAATFPSDLQLSQADHLLYFLDNRCELSALRDHFSLTSHQVLQFLAAPAVLQALESIKNAVHAAFTINALKARDFAISKLHIVCHDLVRQAAISAGGIVNEAAQSKTINNLRLASSQIGRFASATIAPHKSRRTSSTITDPLESIDSTTQTDIPANPAHQPPLPIQLDSSTSAAASDRSSAMSARDRLKQLNALSIESPEFLDQLASLAATHRSEVLQSLCARKFPNNPEAQKLFNQIRAINAGSKDPFNRTIALLNNRLPEVLQGH